MARFDTWKPRHSFEQRGPTTKSTRRRTLSQTTTNGCRRPRRHGRHRSRRRPADEPGPRTPAAPENIAKNEIHELPRPLHVRSSSAAGR